MTSGGFPEVMGAAEIARELGGLSRQRVQQLITDRAANGFPEPVAVLEMGKVWLAEDIRAWAAKNRPPDRPRR